MKAVAAEPEYETAEQQNRKATATTLSSRSRQVVGQVGEQTAATAAVKRNSFTQSYGSSWLLKIEIALATESGVAATKEGTLPILLLLFIILKRLSDLPMRSEVICVCVCTCVFVSEFTCLPKVETKKVAEVVVVGQTNNNCVTFVDKPKRRSRSEDHYHHPH